ncbi:pectinesterase family protein [Dactylosporangium sp. NPDC051541]|uniref:pectinesterase family protein n=1 Tax=Dactylosporangium sp. NPDC051541 TaxID=3363977 RepID=UPI0037BA9FAA
MALRRATAVFAASTTAAAGLAWGIAYAGPASAAAGCRVDYKVTNQWQGGFGADVTVTNLGDPVNGWTLTWTYTAGQSVTQAWNAAVTQSGAAVTARNVDYNANLATGGTAGFGFNGAWNNATNPVPASFALNGVTCTGTPTTASPTASATPSNPGSPSPSRSTGPTPSASSSPQPPAGAIVVAADGSGAVTTVQAAVDRVPANTSTTATIWIKKGTYTGRVVVPSNKPNIVFTGATGTASDVVITASRPQSTDGDMGSATVVLNARAIEMRNLTVRNDYNEAANGASQALALYANGDRQIFRNVRIIGDQDTFLTKTAGLRQYFYQSYIEGDVDFIYGPGTAVFDNCEIFSSTRNSSNNGYVTASATPGSRTYGILIVNSRLTSDGAAGTVYLGRPWHPGGDTSANPQVLIRDSTLGAHVRTAQPWTDMSGFSWKDARLAEYRNTGPGAGVNSNRPQMSDATAANYTAQKYLAGSDGWNPVLG